MDKILLQKNKKNILVMGDIMLDQYIFIESNRISAEIDIPIYLEKNYKNKLGGSSNVANIIKKFNQNVTILSVCGKNNNQIIKLLEEKNIDYKLITENRKTTVKKRYFIRNQQIFRVDDEDKHEINENSITEILSFLEKNIDNYDSVVLSDYKKGFFTKSLTRKIIDLCNKKKIKTFVDPVTGTDYEKYKNCYLLKPNLKTSQDITKQENINDIFSGVLEKIKPENLVITLGEDGYMYSENKKIFTSNKNLVNNLIDTCGCGDIFLALLALTDGSGIEYSERLKLCNFSSQIKLNYIGSDFFLEDFFKNKSIYLNNHDLIKILKFFNRKIIFTNGCFDILHVGHIEFLKKIKEKYKNEIIIIALNTDSSVKRIKGEKRPINNQFLRIETIKNLGLCNFVTFFEENTPYELIKKIKPTKIVKGGKDYTFANVVGNDICDIEILHTENNYNTSDIIRETLLKNGT